MNHNCIGNEPLVSVYCLAYNHEKYIRSALEGFVMQKTNFRYEVFVHDDASTDHTADIIQEYADAYPDIIKPIFQTENQYSKSVQIVKSFIFPLMTGKYIAACEGDDYWCDESKLQQQVDWMEGHPEYSLCVHNTKKVDVITQEECLMYSNDCDKDIPLKDILVRGGGQFQTSSILFRSEFKYVPEEFRIKGMGDYSRAVYLGICGKVRYLHQVMSVYRRNVPGAYTTRIKAESLDETYRRHSGEIHMLQAADRFTNGEYTDYINELIHKREFNWLLRINDTKTILADYRDIYDGLSTIDKLKLQLKDKLPGLIEVYRKIRDR